LFFSQAQVTTKLKASLLVGYADRTSLARNTFDGRIGAANRRDNEDQISDTDLTVWSRVAIERNFSEPFRLPGANPRFQW